MGTEKARAYFEELVEKTKKAHTNADLVQTGEFGAMMDVTLVRHYAILVKKS